jgi:RNA binding exosome subunit
LKIIITLDGMVVTMGIHHVSWQSTASGVEDEYIHAAALSWLIGDDEAVSIERMNSYHGSPIHLVTAEIKSRGKATKSLSRLGSEVLDLLASELASRLDEDNVIHIRLDLNDLLAGKVTLTLPGGRPTVKGKAKLEVYPGDVAMDVAISTIEKAKNVTLN